MLFESFESLFLKMRNENTMINFDTLTVNQLPIVSLIGKFEAVSFIHTFVTFEKNLKIEFPRYNISFEYRNDTERIHSLDYANYCLRLSQKLPDALYFFDQYLLLENCSGDVKMVVPQGKVCKADNGSVFIEIDKSPTAELSIHAYDLHARLEIYQTKSIHARLQLAAIFAAEGTLFPEKKNENDRNRNSNRFGSSVLGQ
jgi:hypothetical protein